MSGREEIEVNAAILEQLQVRLNRAIRHAQWNEVISTLNVISATCTTLIPTARALRDLQHTHQMRKKA